MMSFALDEARDALAHTPVVLRGLVAGLGPAWLSASPAPGEWSAHQVICHLAYVEESDWMIRTRMILEDGPSRTFPPVEHGDQGARYRGRTTAQVLEAFADDRHRNLSELDGLGLTAADLEREGNHPSLGRVTLRQLLATWVVHDLNHVAQLQASLASHYADEVGPWRSLLGILDHPRT